MSVKITIERSGKDVTFTWEGDSDEARALWVRCEDLAKDDDHDPMTIAFSAIQQVRDHGEPDDVSEQNGLRVWATYAIMRQITDQVDLASIKDQAGVLAGPPTVFDLVEHQQIRALVSIPRPGKMAIELRGENRLDS
jgi:hypothetical protein